MTCQFHGGGVTPPNIYVVNFRHFCGLKKNGQVGQLAFCLKSVFFSVVPLVLILCIYIYILTVCEHIYLYIVTVYMYISDIPTSKKPMSFLFLV